MIIGITGTNGSGKDTVAQLLIDKLHWPHFSLSGEIREMAHERNIDPTRPNLINLGNAIRQEFGSGHLTERILKKAKDNFIATSIRNPEEVEAFRNSSAFKLIGIDAPIQLRYKRIKNAKTRAGAKVGEHQITFVEFCDQEKQEMAGGTHSQQLAKVMNMADVKLENGGTIKELDKIIDQLIDTLIYDNVR